MFFLLRCPEAVLSTSFYGCQKTPQGVFDAMSWLVRPSLPWCFSVAGWCFQHKFLRISEDTLGSFLVRFRGLSVLHCHGV